MRGSIDYRRDESGIVGEKVGRFVDKIWWLMRY